MTNWSAAYYCCHLCEAVFVPVFWWVCVFVHPWVRSKRSRHFVLKGKLAKGLKVFSFFPFCLFLMSPTFTYSIYRKVSSYSYVQKPLYSHHEWIVLIPILFFILLGISDVTSSAGRFLSRRCWHVVSSDRSPIEMPAECLKERQPH